MEPARPSATALRVALRRAAHQVYDVRPLVLDDPYAVRILGEHAAELSKTPGRDRANRRPGKKPRPYSVGLRAFLVARSRYAEDLLASAVGRGVAQYVLLGAGLDTFAHRNPHAGLRVFEVDHPATQAWKRGLIAASGMGEPPGLRYAPVDFERESLSEALELAGFDAAAPAFFAWLGVVPYLTIEAFRGTLAAIAACAPGSGLVLDYGLPRWALPEDEKLARDSLAARVGQAGEPFQLYFTPEDVAAELGAFRAIEDLGGAEINARYFAGRSDALRVPGTGGRYVSGWL